MLLALLPRSFNFKKSLLILGVFWVLVQIILFGQFGIVTGFESEKYIYQADFFLKTGHYTTGNFLFYSVQILLIALSKTTNTFPWLVVLVQLLLNGVSIVLFYKLCFSFTQSHFRSFLVTALFIVMIYYQLYNVHLFTESLYFSFGIIYTYLLFSIKKLSPKNILLLLLGASLLYLTRPTGIFFIPATVVYILFRFYQKKAFLLLLSFIVLGIVLLYFLLNFTLNSGGELDFLLPYLDERIICGVPTIKGQHTITVPMEKNSVEGLWYIISHHTSLFLSLGGKRLIAFWGVVREYYTTSHNIFIAFYFYSAYLLILLNLKNLVHHFLPQTAFFCCIIFFIALTVTLSCDEWHNRFILALLPFFLLMACNSLMTKSKTDPHVY